MKRVQSCVLGLSFVSFFLSSSFATENFPKLPVGPIKFECPFKVGAASVFAHTRKSKELIEIIPNQGGDDDDVRIYNFNAAKYIEGAPIADSVLCYRDVDGPHNPYEKFQVSNEIKYCQIDKRDKNHHGHFWCK